MISHTICEIWNPAFWMCRAKLQTRVWASNSFFYGLGKHSNTSVDFECAFWMVCVKLQTQVWASNTLFGWFVQKFNHKRAGKGMFCVWNIFKWFQMHFANLKVVLSKVTRFFPSIVLPCIASLYIYSFLLSQYLHTWSLGVFWASTFSWRLETFQASYIKKSLLKIVCICAL